MERFDEATTRAGFFDSGAGERLGIAGLFLGLFIFLPLVGAGEIEVGDPAAKKYLLSCAGCHSLSGAKLKGPELSGVGGWPADDLARQIKKMEKDTGPLSAPDIEGLVVFLKDPNARERMKVQEAAIAAQFAAKMDPPSAALGCDLFLGKAPLLNGGLSCVACHSVGGEGGTLGPDLSGIHSKMGDTALISAIEKSNFQIMEPHYRDRRVTVQEAIHLNKYFSTLDPNPVVSPGTDLAWGGVATGLAVLFGMTAFYKTRRPGNRTPLKRRRK